MAVLGQEHRQVEAGCAQPAKQAASAGWSLAMTQAAPTSEGGVRGTSIGTLVVAEAHSHAVGRRPPGFVSLVQGWSARNIRLVKEVAWYLRSFRDGFRLVGGDFNMSPIDFLSQKRRSTVGSRQLRGEPRHGFSDRRRADGCRHLAALACGNQVGGEAGILEEAQRGGAEAAVPENTNRLCACISRSPERYRCRVTK